MRQSIHSINCLNTVLEHSITTCNHYCSNHCMYVHVVYVLDKSFKNTKRANFRSSSDELNEDTCVEGLLFFVQNGICLRRSIPFFILGCNAAKRLLLYKHRTVFNNYLAGGNTHDALRRTCFIFLQMLFKIYQLH